MAFGRHAPTKWRAQYAFYQPALRKGSNYFSDIGNALSSGQSIVSIHYQVLLFAEPSTFSDAETKLNSLFERQGFSLVAEDGLHLPTLSLALPFGGSSRSLDLMKRFGRTRTVKLTNAVSLMPLYGEWQGNDYRQPPLMLLAGRRGQLAGWTPFESDSNFNTCIVGQSGQGKSVAMQEIMAAMISIGGSVVVIDDGIRFRIRQPSLAAPISISVMCSSNSIALPPSMQPRWQRIPILPKQRSRCWSIYRLVVSSGQGAF